LIDINCEVLLEAGTIRFRPMLSTALAAMIGVPLSWTEPPIPGRRHPPESGRWRFHPT